MSQKHEVTDFLLATGAHRHRPVQPADPLGQQQRSGETIRNNGDDQLAQLSVALLCTGWTVGGYLESTRSGTSPCS
jgi:hypothetical protein